jgi:hypothetical protein
VEAAATKVAKSAKKVNHEAAVTYGRKLVKRSLGLRSSAPAIPPVFKNGDADAVAKALGIAKKAKKNEEA